ncbi:hypothetical protein CGGC5_v015840 [Colletotrichum fructicola Nara gc5]|uniref:Uncharacterized protein n=1 Tax=Colletotrichum fructicola (strain Nara gc5) TaxID=1213859 RepID=A0A7J6IGS6_COLFN|nr:hypothetical protein CGGC5_v015840 [Colletotrichum fructicola Nara gc5]KAF5485494.1 hypothetical protein CGCF413_v013482 [Colletotrichum fructicola]
MPSLGLVHADTLDIRPPDFGRKNTGCEVREAVESKPKPCTKPSRRSQNATGNKLRNEQGAQAFHCRAKHSMMILEVPQMPTTSEHTSKLYLQSIPRVALAVFHITVFALLSLLCRAADTDTATRLVGCARQTQQHHHHHRTRHRLRPLEDALASCSLTDDAFPPNR